MAAARATLAGLKKSPGRGAGPLLPRRDRLQPLPAPTYTWAPPGVRLVVPYENPGGRRNVLNALAVPGTHRHALTWRTASHLWKGEHVLDFLRHALPGRAGVPRIVVLDNASCHRARTVRQARRELAERGLWLWYLPAYRPGAERHRVYLPHRQARGHAPAHLTATATLTAAVQPSAGQRPAATFRISHAECLAHCRDGPPPAVPPPAVDHGPVLLRPPWSRRAPAETGFGAP